MATTKATTLAHTLGGISSDISTAEINRLDGVTGDLQTQLDAKAPLASPDFTGTVDLTGTTISLDNDQISGDKVSGGTIGAGTFSGTIGNSATFPAGIVLQTVFDNYNSQTETNSSTKIKVCECAFTTKKANSKLAYWSSAFIGGRGDSDNVNLVILLGTGTTQSSFDSSRYLPTDNRGAGTQGQTNGKQIYLDVTREGEGSTYPNLEIGGTFNTSDVITTSYAKDTQIVLSMWIWGGCHINRPDGRANVETGITSLIVQEIAT